MGIDHEWTRIFTNGEGTTARRPCHRASLLSSLALVGRKAITDLSLDHTACGADGGAGRGAVCCWGSVTVGGSLGWRGFTETCVRDRYFVGFERRAYGASPVGGQSSALEMHWREALDSAEGAGKFGISFKVVVTDGVTAKLKVTSRISTTSTDEIESTVDGANQTTLV